jgi:trehalose-6-phosphate synthase
VAAFPIGIDPERFAQALETQEVQMNIAKLLNRYAGRKVGAWQCLCSSSCTCKPCT